MSSQVRIPVAQPRKTKKKKKKQALNSLHNKWILQLCDRVEKEHAAAAKKVTQPPKGTKSFTCSKCQLE